MRASRTFRLLIALTWLMPLIATVVDFAFSNHSDQDAAARSFAAHMVSHTLSWWQILVFAFTLSLFVVSIIVSVGLWFFRRWARILYLPFGAFYVCWWPFGMPQPELPIAVADFTTFITFAAQGAVAAMSFLPPLAARFQRERPNQSMELTTSGGTTQLSHD